MPHGKICYLAIPADRVDDSARFDADIFGWAVRERGDGNLAFDDTGGVGGTWVKEGDLACSTSSAEHPQLVTRLILLAPAGVVPGAAAIESLATRFCERPLPREARLALLQRTFFAPGNKPP